MTKKLNGGKFSEFKTNEKNILSNKKNEKKIVAEEVFVKNVNCQH